MIKAVQWMATDYALGLCVGQSRACPRALQLIDKCALGARFDAGMGPTEDFQRCFGVLFAQILQAARNVDRRVARERRGPRKTPDVEGFNLSASLKHVDSAASSIVFCQLPAHVVYVKRTQAAVIQACGQGTPETMIVLHIASEPVCSIITTMLYYNCITI